MEGEVLDNRTIWLFHTPTAVLVSVSRSTKRDDIDRKNKTNKTHSTSTRLATQTRTQQKQAGRSTIDSFYLAVLMLNLPCLFCLSSFLTSVSLLLCISTVDKRQNKTYNSNYASTNNRTGTAQ